MILYKYGGVYADLDVEALKPLDDLVQKHEIVLGQEPLAHSHLLNGVRRTVCNAIMMSAPGHPFWLEVLNTIRDSYGGDPVDNTGPRMLERVFKRFSPSELGKAYPVWVSPPEMLYPVWDGGTVVHLKKTCKKLKQKRGKYSSEVERQLFLSTCRALEESGWYNGPVESSYTIHHWSHTWLRDMDEAKHPELTPRERVIPIPITVHG